MDDRYKSFSPPTRSAALDDYELRGQPALAALADVVSRFLADDPLPELAWARAAMNRCGPKTR
jgi:hypothetical protein